MRKSFSTLLAKLADVDTPLPVADLHQLSDLPSASAAAFEQAWPAIDLHRRREIMHHLAEICQINFAVDFTPIALLGIQDEDSRVRLSALDTFWDAESPELVAPLLQLMEGDSDVTVQAGAAQALGQFVLIGELGQLPRQLFGRLMDHLLAVTQDREKALLVRCRALEALAAADRSEVLDLIQEAYKSREETLKISAVCAMGRTADPSWEPIIETELGSVSPSMRYHAAQAAGQLELQAVAPQLIELLEDPDPEVMAAGIWALGEIGGQEALAALEPLLDDEEVGGLVQDALDMIDLADEIRSFPSGAGL